MLSQRIKSLLRDYFTLTSRERKGALSLATLNFILIGCLLWNNFLFAPDPLPENCFTPEFYAFENAISHPTQDDHYAKKSIAIPAELHVNSNFDPNTLSDSGWLAMGLAERQVRTIRNYLNKGGKFRSPEDLRRMYGLEAGQYEKMEPYIVIVSEASTPFQRHVSRDSSRQRTHLSIDLNSADTIELAKLPLIGAGRARMIWKYREKLGGYHSPGQLLEVFTIDSSVYEAIISHVTISGKVMKFNINGDTLKHPYLPRSASRAIVAYRKQHGPFNDTTSVRAVGVIADSTWYKLVPYIGFE